MHVYVQSDPQPCTDRRLLSSFQHPRRTFVPVRRRDAIARSHFYEVPQRGHSMLHTQAHERAPGIPSTEPSRVWVPPPSTGSRVSRVGRAATLLAAPVREPAFGADGTKEPKRAFANARDRKVPRDWQPYVWEPRGNGRGGEQPLGAAATNPICVCNSYRQLQAPGFGQGPYIAPRLRHVLSFPL